MTTIADLSVVIGANISDLQSKTRTAQRDVETFQSKTSKAMEIVRDAALPIAGAVMAIGVASAKAAIDFEADFANVIKTVSGTDEELNALRDSIRDMATVGDLSALDNAHESLTNIAAIAGQLGVPTSDIEEFTRVVGSMTVATDMSAESAATFAARFANVTGMPITEVENLADAIVTLGNNSAAQESEIAAVANRLASLSGLNFEVDEILGLSTAVASLGLSPELGSSNIIKTVTEMTNAAGEGGPKLQAFADAIGMIPADFKALQESDPAAAFDSLLESLSEMDASEALATLQDLGITSQEQQRTIMTLAQGYDTVSESMAMAEESFAGNGAAMEELAAKADTTQGSINTFENNIRDLGISLGETLLPAVNNVLESLIGMTSALNEGDATKFADNLGGMFQPIYDLASDIGVFDTINNISNLLTGQDLLPEDLDLGAGLSAWVGAIENFRTIVAAIIDDVRRRFLMLKLDIELGAAQMILSIQQALPAGMQDQGAIADAQDFLAEAGPDRTAFDIVDRMNKAIRDEMAKGDGFDISDMVTLTEDGYALPVEKLFGSLMDNPEAISENLRNTLGEALNEAVIGGDIGEMGALLEIGDIINFDPETLKANIQQSMAMAMAVGDEEGMDALMAVAVGLDIELDMGFLSDVQAQIEAQTISATVKANINVQANYKGQAVDSIQGAGANVGGGGPSIPMFHDGGVFRSPMGEGLALLRDGERVLTPEQTRAYDSGRGATVINYSSFGETPYNALQKIRRASSDAGY